MSKYPRMGSDQRKPRRDVEFANNVGKPCIVCNRFTTGRKWIQVSPFRGEDELVYVCSEHWKGAHVIVESFVSSLEQANE